MTTDPAAPGADAVYLYREDITNNVLHSHSYYVRVKVLTEKGKDYADVELPDEYRLGHFETENHIRDLSGRTIHPDGSIVPFAGKPFERTIAKIQGVKVTSKVFTMPDVQVGSILEYRFTIQYDDYRINAPHWYIQQPLYTHTAHYSFIASVTAVAYLFELPKDVRVLNKKSGTYTLDMNNVPAEPAEDFLPPMQTISYSVLFFYNIYSSKEEFWKTEGEAWSKDQDEFASPSRNLKNATRELVSGATGSDAQLRAIYAAVMKMDNSDFSREHTEQEDRSEGIKEAHNADGIFKQRRGNSYELTLLFIAMARAAGFKAYAMQIPNRGTTLFIDTYLSFNQFDDVIAIVEVDGKELYFDPGTRYCTYGTLHWKHTLATGLRQTEKGSEIASTPAPSFKETTTLDVVDLNVGSSGTIQGTARIVMTGTGALKWRQAALRSDKAEVIKDFESGLQDRVPSGVHITVHEMTGLEDPDQPLTAVADFSGSMGTATSKRMFLPAFFLQANERPIFAQAKRELPIDLRFPYLTQEKITIHLPVGSKVEAAPEGQAFPLERSAEYVSKVKSDGQSISLERTVVMANPLYKVEEYADLKSFFDKINAADQQQIILRRPSGSSAQ